MTIPISIKMYKRKEQGLKCFKWFDKSIFKTVAAEGIHIIVTKNGTLG